MVGEARTGHGRDVRRDTAFSFYFCELKGRSEFEEGVTAEESTDEDAVGFEGFSDLDKDACVVNGMSLWMLKEYESRIDVPGRSFTQCKLRQDTMASCEFGGMFSRSFSSSACIRSTGTRRHS